MNKEELQEYIEENLVEDDTLIGFYQAQVPMKFWLFFVVGPFAALSMKFYMVAVSEKGVYFHKLSLWGKIAQSDFFAYNEIEGLQIGKGMLQRPMTFFFDNTRKLYLRGQLKGTSKVAKFEPQVQEYLEQHIEIRD